MKPVFPGRRPIAKILLLVMVVVLPLLSTPITASAQIEPTGEVTRTDGVEGRVTSQGNPLIDAEVWDIEFIGNTAFIAGKFLQVTRATTDWSRVDQPFLAAFDASTGQWLPDFRPVIDGPVWALEIGANGHIVAGGEFTTVNGVARPGIVSLDPTTGATDSEFDAFVERRFVEDKFALVRDLHRHGDWLYAIGNFSHASDGNTTMQASKVARFNATTGKPDTTWVPTLSGKSGWAVDTSSDGQRVFLGGEFTYINATVGTELFGAVDATTGALIPGYDNGFNVNPHPVWPVGGIIYDLGVSGDRVFLSGAEHFWEIRSVADGESLQLTTSYNGNWFNDTQVTEVEGDMVFIGCHCLRHWGYANHDIVAATGEISGTLTKEMTGGEGVWAVGTAPDGCIWMGGDLRGTRSLRGVPYDGTVRWVGRFARFCPPDQAIEQHRFDFGTDSSPVPAGWNRVSPTTNTDLVSWSGAVTDARDRGGNPPGGYLNRDFVFSSDSSTLNINVDDGNWRVQVVMGDSCCGHDIMAVRAEGELINGAVNNAANTFMYVDREGSGPEPRHFDVAVDDGELNLEFFDNGGADPNWVLTQVTLEAIEEPTETELVGAGTTWRVAAPTDWPDGWATPAFDDGAWQSATTDFGYGDGDEATTIDDSNRPAAILGRSAFTIDDPAEFDHLIVDLQVDDGATVWINDEPVVAHNVPDGFLTAYTLASSTIWGSAEQEWHRYPVAATSLVAGTNTIAISVHQSWPSSRDLGFDMVLTGSIEVGQDLEPAPEISLTPAVGPAVLRAYDGSSRYLPGETDPPDGWTTVGFDDAAWTSATGVLGFGEADIDTELESGHTTYYIRAEFDVDAALAARAATIDLLRDDGAAVYLNGQELGRDQLPDGAIDSSTLATAFVWGSAETTPVRFDIPAGALQQGTNVLAVEVHQAHPDSADLRAGLEIRTAQ